MITPSTAIVGGGGIGSYFCQFLNKALATKQFGIGVDNHSFTVFDPKGVSQENCLHQDYLREYELGHPKAAVLGERYGFKYATMTFEDRNLAQFSSFIICADNRQVRNLIYRHCALTDKPFLDLRCRGDMYSLYTDLTPLKELMDSIGKTKEVREDTTGFSCMTDEDKASMSLMMGHAAVAVAGVQLLLNRQREEPFPAKKEMELVV